MPTEIVTIASDPPAAEIIARAAAILRAGGLVAFPTETVYGLGANALNPEAVLRIFQAKGGLVPPFGAVEGSRSTLVFGNCGNRLWLGTTVFILLRMNPETHPRRFFGSTRYSMTDTPHPTHHSEDEQSPQQCNSSEANDPPHREKDDTFSFGDEDESSPKTEREDDEASARRKHSVASPEDRARRVTVRFWVGFGIVCAVVLIISGILFAIRTIKFAPFRAELATYLATPTGAAPPGTPVGRVVLVDLKEKDIDRMHFEIPDGLRAATPEEVTTIVWLEWDRREVAKYTSGGSAYQWFCTLTVIDLKTKGRITSQAFTGSDPPKMAFGKRFESHEGDKPTQEIPNFLTKLPRR